MIKTGLLKIFSVSILLLVSFAAPASPAKDIVSLDLCTDWMLLRYADRSRVKAFSPLLYKYPADWVPAGLPTHDGSLEDIIRLDPELMIAGEFNALLLRKRLGQLGRRVAVLSLPTDLDSIQDYHRQFLSIIGVDPLQNPVDWGLSFPATHRTLLLLGANGIGTGRNTLEHDLLRRAGWRNYLEPDGYLWLDLERIVASPPDSIYWSSPASQSLSNLFVQHPAIAHLTRRAANRGQENWRWQCPGPWSLELIEELAAW